MVCGGKKIGLNIISEQLRCAQPSETAVVFLCKKIIENIFLYGIIIFVCGVL